MLSEKELNEIREELESSERPLFFFHDDVDGLCSFLLLYRHIQRGKGHIVKTNPRITKDFVRFAEGYDPDKIFILDVAQVDQEFVDEVKLPVVWIDHHGPHDIKNVKYFNPRIKDKDAYIPASQICYEVVKKDLWLGTIGTIGDGGNADFVKDFAKEFPDILDPKIKDRDKMQFESGLTNLIQIFSFNLKGGSEEIKKAIKILTRIESPYEILKQETERGRLICKRCLKISREYEELLKEALKIKAKNNIYVFEYTEKTTSLSSEIANVMFYRHPEWTIVIARKKGDEMKCSLRSHIVDLRKVVEKTLKEVEGFGGGHPQSSAIILKAEGFKRFIEILQEDL